MASLLSGFALGMGRLILELQRDSLSGFLHAYATINFLNFAAILFVICATVLVVVSLLTPPPNQAKIRGLTFQTAGQGADLLPPEEQERMQSDPDWRRRDALLSIVVVVLVTIVMFYFTGWFFN